jgi:hypothetical protein
VGMATLPLPSPRGRTTSTGRRAPSLIRSIVVEMGGTPLVGISGFTCSLRDLPDWRNP